MEIRSCLETLAAAPRDWRVTTHFADGSARHHDAHSATAAETYATGERRKVGTEIRRRLSDLSWSEPVRVSAVTVGRN